MPTVSDKRKSKTIFMNFVKNAFYKYENEEQHCINISSVLERTKTEIKNKVLCRTKYEVYDDRGVEKLILKKRGPTGGIIEVLPFEELFDILYELHIKNDHKCLDLAPLLKNYKYPIACFNILKRSCPQCQNTMDKSKKNDVVKLNVGSVYIIPINIKRTEDDDEEHFRFMLIYVHKITNFIVLRPLTEKNPLEISVELLKIITEYQPPQNLWIHGYDKKLYEDIRVSFVKIWPLFNIGFKHVPAEYSVPSNVVTRLNALYQRRRQASWVILLPYIQKTMNLPRLQVTTHGVQNSSIKGPHVELLNKKLQDNFGGRWSQILSTDHIDEESGEVSEFTNTYDDLFETVDYSDDVTIPDFNKEETILPDRHDQAWTDPEWDKNVEIISTISLAENTMTTNE